MCNTFSGIVMLWCQCIELTCNVLTVLSVIVTFNLQRHSWDYNFSTTECSFSLIALSLHHFLFMVKIFPFHIFLFICNLFHLGLDIPLNWWAVLLLMKTVVFCESSGFPPLFTLVLSMGQYRYISLVSKAPFFNFITFTIIQVSTLWRLFFYSFLFF
jgi:hypothetical protein